MCTPAIPAPSKGSLFVKGRITESNAFVQPRIHLEQQPRNPIWPEPYPLREFARRFKSPDVLGCVRDATDRLQLLFRHEPLIVLSHRISPFREASRCLGEKAAPVGTERLPPPFEGVEGFDPHFVPPFVPPWEKGNKKGNGQNPPLGNDWVTARRGNRAGVGLWPGGKR